ncbi:MAG: AraC family transcriptional regulator ligand-binding domain-containing protein [Deltaproteobacteria bacterium]|nr:AraC family transcriptional regulator ligand-binding domain-containing protein [Deltaproteobacteria bacterium]
MDAAHGISVALLRPLSQLLGRLGVDAAAFLEGLGVDDAMPPDSYVPAERVDRGLDAIAARRGDPAFALTMAREAAVRPLGMFGHLVWLSGTVRDALGRATRFWAMVTRRTKLTLEEGGGRAVVRQHPAPGVPRGRILTEFPFASLALRGREATGGRFALRAVRFAHAGEATPAYADVFRAPVAFGAAFDEVELDAAQLDLPLASADPITSAALEANIARLVPAPGADPLVDRVRRALGQGAASLPDVARRIGTSSRTLRRHLEREGLTLRGLVDDVRRARADELLAAGTAVKEVAFALGFSEPSAFSRAYKRWTGRAPRSS